MCIYKKSSAIPFQNLSTLAPRMCAFVQATRMHGTASQSSTQLTRASTSSRNVLYVNTEHHCRYSRYLWDDSGTYAAMHVCDACDVCDSCMSCMNVCEYVCVCICVYVCMHAWCVHAQVGRQVGRQVVR